MEITITTPAEFRKAHGPHLEVPNTGYLFFEDGSLATTDFGILHPVEGIDGEGEMTTYQRLTNIVEYWKQKLKNSIQDFERVRTSLAQDAANARKYSNLAPPSRKDVNILKRLRDKALQTAEKLKKAEQALMLTPEVEYDMQRIEEEAELEMAADNIFQEVISIQLPQLIEQPWRPSREELNEMKRGIQHMMGDLMPKTKARAGVITEESH